MMLPIGTTLQKWADTLIIDFPKDNIPFLADEKGWKLWGNALVQENTFSLNGAPGTHGFLDWQTWAQAVFKCLANN